MNEKETTIIDFEQICRLCLRERKLLGNIFKSCEDNSTVTICHKIMACASINLDENDGLPNGICVDCLSSVNAAFEFRLQCENADKTLHEIQSVLVKHESDNEGNEYVEISETEKPVKVEINNVIEDSNSTVVLEKLKVDSTPKKITFVVNTPAKNEAKYEISESKSIYYRSKNSCELSTGNAALDNPVTIYEAQNQRILVSNNQECYKVVMVSSKDEPRVEPIKTNYKKKYTKSKQSLVKSQCPFCNKTLGRLDEHIRLFHRNRVYICTNQNCGAEFLTLKNLQSHQLTCYNLKKAYKCSRCLKEFHRKSNFKAHVKRHSDKKEFQCQLCDRAFVDSTGLRRHFLKHHEPEQEIFISGCCGKKFKSKEGLKKHIRNGTCGMENFQNDSVSSRTVKVAS